MLFWTRDASSRNLCSRGESNSACSTREARRSSTDSTPTWRFRSWLSRDASLPCWFHLRSGLSSQSLAGWFARPGVHQRQWLFACGAGVQGHRARCPRRFPPQIGLVFGSPWFEKGPIDGSSSLTSRPTARVRALSTPFLCSLGHRGLGRPVVFGGLGHSLSSILDEMVRPRRRQLLGPRSRDGISQFVRVQIGLGSAPLGEATYNPHAAQACRPFVHLIGALV